MCHTETRFWVNAERKDYVRAAYHTFKNSYYSEENGCLIFALLVGDICQQFSQICATWSDFLSGLHSTQASSKMNLNQFFVCVNYNIQLMCITIMMVLLCVVEEILKKVRRTSLISYHCAAAIDLPLHSIVYIDQLSCFFFPAYVFKFLLILSSFVFYTCIFSMLYSTSTLILFFSSSI